MKFRAYAAEKAGAELKPFEYDPGTLRDDQVDIAVESCGVCHSDMSMLNNEWGISQYPFVPGHEVVGKIRAVGRSVKHLSIGQRVGVGWYSGSCMTCPQCMSGDHNLCATSESTIVGRYGGFADHVRCQATWATPIPDSLDPEKAGPLFCGGITVFNPIVQFGVLPTHRVGVIGIGGLGHLALQFLNKWGCEVVAFTSSDSKKAEAMRLGAHHAISSRDEAQLEKWKGRLDFVLSTVAADMNWSTYIGLLAPKGRLHFVGVAPTPVSTHVFPLLVGQKNISGSPLGSPATTATMIDFCARHKIAPVTEVFPLSKANEAISHLHSGKARYRIVLKNDLK